MPKKRLAIVSTHPIQYNAPLFRLLSQRGIIDVKVFYTWSQSKDTVKDKEFGRDIVWDIPLLEGYKYEYIENVSQKPKQKFRGLVNPELIPAIQQWKPDAVLVFGWNFSSHFKVMRHFHGRVPVWFRGDSTLLDEVPGVKTFIRRQVLRFVYSFVDHAFYVGQNNKKYFLAHGLKESQLTFAPHAIDNTRFSNENAVNDGKRWRQELGYSDNDIVLVYAGKIYGVKNMISFTQQFKKYVESSDNSHLKLLVIGNGAEENSLATHPSIKRLPFQNQSKMPAVYNIGDILVLPSISETWGLVVNEAFAAGKPVIVSNKVGCAIDLVKDGENGFYFSLTDETANPKIFSRIETSNLDIISKNNRNKISKWSHEAIAKALEKQLND